MWRTYFDGEFIEWSDARDAWAEFHWRVRDPRCTNVALWYDECEVANNNDNGGMNLIGQRWDQELWASEGPSHWLIDPRWGWGLYLKAEAQIPKQVFEDVVEQSLCLDYDAEVG